MNYHMKCDPKKTGKIVEDVKPAVLIAATKYTDADQLSILEENGVTIFGENRVQDFLKKWKEYKGHAHWHFIGTLQSNKVKYIIKRHGNRHFSNIETSENHPSVLYFKSKEIRDKFLKEQKELLEIAKPLL